MKGGVYRMLTLEPGRKETYAGDHGLTAGYH